MKLVIEVHEEVLEGIVFKNKNRINLKPSEIAILHGIPLDSIISDIETARNKDKLCEYPYNICIEKKKKKVDTEKSCRTCFWKNNDKYLYPCCECNRNYNPGYDKWDPNYRVEIGGDEKK